MGKEGGSEGPRLLQRLPEIEVPADEPFKHDGLDRQGVAINLSALLGSMEGPFVVALNGPWGGGKTTFLRMWRATLERDGHVCVSFKESLQNEPFTLAGGRVTG